MRTEPVGKSILAGALAGLVAAFAMNQFQAAVSAVSKAKPSSGGDDATVKAAQAISTNVFQHELTADEKKWAGPAVHYGLGTALGAVYGALADQTEVAETGDGAAFGAAVWLVADEFAVPAAGLSGPPTETPVSGHLKALASHLVFGWVTHWTRKLILS